MPIYIEQIGTQKLYGKTGTWVSDATKALELLSLQVARQLCRSLDLRGAHIVELDSKGGRTVHRPTD